MKNVLAFLGALLLLIVVGSFLLNALYILRTGRTMAADRVQPGTPQPQAMPAPQIATSNQDPLANL